MLSAYVAAVSQRITFGPSVVGRNPFARAASVSRAVKSPSGPTRNIALTWLELFFVAVLNFAMCFLSDTACGVRLAINFKS